MFVQRMKRGALLPEIIFKKEVDHTDHFLAPYELLFFFKQVFDKLLAKLC